MPKKLSTRPHSYAFCGGAFGDEGKGRIVDTYVEKAQRDGKKVIVYRDNGGSNAGHTVAFGSTKVALHQLLSGVFVDGAVNILGKDMVLHPSDLVAEISDVKQAAAGKLPATVYIDAEATLCLDTHRAFESALKDWQKGGSGSTGRGISPAYADVVYRHPIQMRDLAQWDEEKLSKHYDMYAGLVSGLGGSMSEMNVARLHGTPEVLGSKKEFLERLKEESQVFVSWITDPSDLLQQYWNDTDTTFVFEKAQAVGLDKRWGMYPDVTASDCTFDGIYSSTRGIIDPDAIEVRAGVIKATYMSSVGSRTLPTAMEESLAERIREDAHEYGATTKRPRDIGYLDLVACRFYAQVGRMTHVALTHLDIAYPETPIKVGVRYTKDGVEVPYKPDQHYLDTVTAKFEELASWDGAAVQTCTSVSELPKPAAEYIEFIKKSYRLPLLFASCGPKRGQEIHFD